MSDSKRRFGLLPHSSKALSIDTASLLLSSKQLKRLETIYERNLKHERDNDSGNESAGENDPPEAFFLTSKTRKEISSLAPSSVELPIPEETLKRRASLQDLKILVEEKPKPGLHRIESSPAITSLEFKKKEADLPNRDINRRTGLLASGNLIKKIQPDVKSYKHGEGEVLKSLLRISAKTPAKQTAQPVSCKADNFPEPYILKNVTLDELDTTKLKKNDNETNKKLFEPPKRNETFGNFLKRRLSGGSCRDNIIAPTSH